MIKLHEDPQLFREAMNFTAAETAFAARLIEKDYYCSVLLEHLAAVGGRHLVFKGGTCLAKVHAEFYRLSEDLDFVLPMAVDAPRSE
ncbi:MAG: nucleotidyl transferase AbiEii/AbiGii toxin family protein, partial [Candidatus Methylomirabilaceae bacterium]